MNEVIRNIQTRRSIRRFSSEPLTKAQLEIIAEAGHCAPVGMDHRTRRLTVIGNPHTIQSLSAAIGAALGADDYDMHNPSAIIIVSEQQNDPNAIANCACAMQNMMLAAHSLGIGSVWINQLRSTHSNPAVRAILDSLGILADHTVLCSLSLGIPAETPADIDRHDMVTDWFL